MFSGSSGLGLKIRVSGEGVGSKVEGLGFRVWGCEVVSLVFRVEGLGRGFVS